MSDQANERLVTNEFVAAWKAWLDAPSGDKATNDRLAKAVAAQGVLIGRPLHTVSGARDLATERGSMTTQDEPWVGIFPQPTRAEPRGEFPQHGDRVGRVLTGPEALAKARKRLADWIAEHPDCKITQRADYEPVSPDGD